MPSTPEEVPVKPKRIPTCPETHRESIDEFLSYFEDKVDRSYNDLRVAAMTDMTDQVAGQIQHWKKYLQCLRWLKSMNDARRKHAPSA